MAAPATPRLGARKEQGVRPSNVHPVLLVILGVVLLVAVVRFAIPSLAGGGGNLAPFTPVIPGRHLVVRGNLPPAAGGANVTTQAPSTRDPFAAPAGY